MKGNIIVLTGRNKAGNYVYYTRAGLQMARAYQPVVANPRTVAQVNQRARFSTIVGISKGLGRYLRTALAPYDNARVSARNVFYTLNKALPMTITAGVVSGIDYTALKLATGSLVGVDFASPDFETSYHIKVEIDADNADGFYGLATDDVLVVAYCPALNQSCGATIKRVTGQKADITTPRYWQGQEVKVYGFAMRGGDLPTETSESVYIGTGEVA